MSTWMPYLAIRYCDGTELKLWDACRSGYWIANPVGGLPAPVGWSPGLHDDCDDCCCDEWDDRGKYAKITYNPAGTDDYDLTTWTIDGVVIPVNLTIDRDTVVQLQQHDPNGYRWYMEPDTGNVSAKVRYEDRLLYGAFLVDSIPYGAAVEVLDYFPHPSAPVTGAEWYDVGAADSYATTPTAAGEFFGFLATPGDDEHGLEISSPWDAEGGTATLRAREQTGVRDITLRISSVVATGRGARFAEEMLARAFRPRCNDLSCAGVDLVVYAYCGDDDDSGRRIIRDVGLGPGGVETVTPIGMGRCEGGDYIVHLEAQDPRIWRTPTLAVNETYDEFDLADCSCLELAPGPCDTSPMDAVIPTAFPGGLTYDLTGPDWVDHWQRQVACVLGPDVTAMQAAVFVQAILDEARSHTGQTDVRYTGIDFTGPNGYVIGDAIYDVLGELIDAGGDITGYPGAAAQLYYGDILCDPRFELVDKEEPRCRLGVELAPDGTFCPVGWTYTTSQVEADPDNDHYFWAGFASGHLPVDEWGNDCIVDIVSYVAQPEVTPCGPYPARVIWHAGTGTFTWEPVVDWVTTNELGATSTWVTNDPLPCDCEIRVVQLDVYDQVTAEWSTVSPPQGEGCCEILLQPNGTAVSQGGWHPADVDSSGLVQRFPDIPCTLCVDTSHCPDATEDCTTADGTFPVIFTPAIGFWGPAYNTTLGDIWVHDKSAIFPHPDRTYVVDGNPTSPTVAIPTPRQVLPPSTNSEAVCADPACPPLTPSPAEILLDESCGVWCEPFTSCWSAHQVAGPSNCFADARLTVSLTTGPKAAEAIRIVVWPDIAGWPAPTDDDGLARYAQNVPPLALAEIHYIPEHATKVIDGVTGATLLTCGGACLDEPIGIGPLRRMWQHPNLEGDVWVMVQNNPYAPVRHVGVSVTEAELS